MQTNRWSIQDLTRMALLAALLCASAYIAFPIPITLVNVTAQTFVLNLVALLLTKEQAGVTVALWILLGAVGVPVYSGGRGGFSELAGPTGGFIVGFLIAAWLIAWLKGDNPSPSRALVLTFIGIPIIDLLGGRLVRRLRTDPPHHRPADHSAALPARRHHQSRWRGAGLPALAEGTASVQQVTKMPSKLSCSNATWSRGSTSPADRRR